MEDTFLFFPLRSSQEEFDFERVNWKDDSLSLKFIQTSFLDFDGWISRTGTAKIGNFTMILIVSPYVSSFRLMYFSLEFEILKIFHFYFLL